MACSIAARSLCSSPLRSRYQAVPQMRCRFQPRPRRTFSRSRSRSRATLEEWYWYPSHSSPSAYDAGMAGVADPDVDAVTGCSYLRGEVIAPRADDADN